MKRFHHLAPTGSPMPAAELLRAAGADGQERERFQNDLRRYLGMRHIFTAASGRTVFYLLLRTLQDQRSQNSTRDAVVLPAYTCPSLVKVVLDAGLRPELVDLHPDTLTYDLDGLSRTANETTLAIVLVHPFGIPQPLEPVRTTARHVGAAVIEDAAQSLGASIDGRKVGTSALAGIYSLGPGKPLSAGGGGILGTDDDDLAAALATAWRGLPASTRGGSWLATARAAAFALAFHPLGWWLAANAGAQRVGENEASWSYGLKRLTQAQAYLGRMGLARLDRVNAERQRVAAAQMTALSLLSGVKFIKDDNALSRATASAKSIYLRLPLLVDRSDRREELYALWSSAGIGVGRMYNKTLVEFFPELGNGTTPADQFPGAAFVARHLLTLPTHHYVSQQDVARVAEVARQAEQRTLIQTFT